MPGAPSVAFLKAHPSVPEGRGEKEKVRGEKVRLKASGTVRKHTLLVFSLVCLMNYHIHSTVRLKRTRLSYTSLSWDRIKSIIKLPRMVLLTYFNLRGLRCLEGHFPLIASLCVCTGSTQCDFKLLCCSVA